MVAVAVTSRSQVRVVLRVEKEKKIRVRTGVAQHFFHFYISNPLKYLVGFRLVWVWFGWCWYGLVSFGLVWLVLVCFGWF